MTQEVTFDRSKRNRLFGLGAGALFLGGAGFAFAPLAFAKVTMSTVDPVATVSHNGRQLDLTGPIVCNQTQAFRMRVIVT